MIRCQTTILGSSSSSISSWKILLGEIGIGKTTSCVFFSGQNLCAFPHSVHLLNLCLVGGWVGGSFFFLCFYWGVLGSLFTWARLLFWFVLLIWVSPQTFTLLCNFFFRSWSRKKIPIFYWWVLVLEALYSVISLHFCSFTPVMGFLLVLNLGDDILLKHGFCFWKIQECEIAKKQRFFLLSPNFPNHHLHNQLFSSFCWCYTFVAHWSSLTYKNPRFEVAGSVVIVWFVVRLIKSILKHFFGGGLGFFLLDCLLAC